MASLGTTPKTLDIRDIKEKVVYPGNKAFGSIFNLQKELLSHYIIIEGLPSYPIDLNTKSSQNIIKDFTGRVIEELGEGFESYLIMLDMFHNGVDESEMIPYLQNFNEEIADATHFWLELMVFSGYEIHSLISWISNYHIIKGKISDLLRTWFKLAEIVVNQEVATSKIPCRWVIKDHMLHDEFLRGGRQLGNNRRDIMKKYLWDITYYLQIARNTLKNKPWKQSEMTTDLNQYEYGISETTISFFKFLYFAGFTPESFYEIYYKKNMVNLFRIKSKY